MLLKIKKSELIESAEYIKPYLYIRFTNEQLYVYYNVPKEKIDEFNHAKSSGKYFIQEIRNDFEYTKINI